MRLGFDAAYCPPRDVLQNMAYGNYTVAAGYVGGFALHKWSKQDWINCQELGYRLIPIWVAAPGSTGHAAGADEGNKCLIAMQESGLESLVVLDIEAHYVVDADFVQGFADALEAGSCDYALYGLAAEIENLGASRLFTWVASPTGPKDYLPDTVGAQLYFGADVDTSLWDDDAPGAALNAS